MFLAARGLRMRAGVRTALIVIVALSATAASARADILGVYFHGQSGMAGVDADQLMSGSDAGGLGPAFGFRAGAHLLVFDAYYDRTEFQRGGISRAVAGLRGDNRFWDVRLTGTAAVGYLWESQAVLGQADSFADRAGPVARAGLSLDYLVNDSMYVGVTFEGEIFAVSPPDATMADIHVGTDVMGSVHAGFQLGL